ncbi:MAG: CBS domain-containing protein, partial [Planctomycetota bacterium]|nr:CBS domain-containing protein [Planctomycetota bacterium]
MGRDHDDLSALQRLFREGSDEDVKRFFLLLRPAELADALESAEEDDRLRVVRLMNAPLASDVLRSVEDDQREDILEDLSAGEIAEIVHESRSDDAADIIGALPPEKAERTLQQLEQEEREELRELLQYGEQTAGAIMQTEVVKVGVAGTVAVALQAVRDADPDDVGEILEVYVVDSDGRPVGTVSPADLLQEEPTTPLREVIEPNPVVVPVSMDQEQIAETVLDHDLVAVPVVDDD